MKDFRIATDGITPEMTFEEEDTVLTNIIVSLGVRKGAWWHDPGFGLELPERAKLNDRMVDIIRQRIGQALQWIIDLGRATEIEVKAERSPRDTGRLDVVIEAVQADGRLVSYQTFMEVA